MDLQNNVLNVEEENKSKTPLKKWNVLLFVLILKLWKFPFFKRLYKFLSSKFRLFLSLEKPFFELFLFEFNFWQNWLLFLLLLLSLSKIYYWCFFCYFQSEFYKLYLHYYFHYSYYRCYRRYSDLWKCKLREDFFLVCYHCYI